MSNKCPCCAIDRNILPAEGRICTCTAEQQQMARLLMQAQDHCAQIDRLMAATRDTLMRMAEHQSRSRSPIQLPTPRPYVEEFLHDTPGEGVRPIEGALRNRIVILCKYILALEAQCRSSSS